MRLPSCWMFDDARRDGGGNIVQNPRIIVRRTAAVGDSLAATVVADKLAGLGYQCEFQTHPNNHCLLKYVPSVAYLSEPNGFAHVDLDRSYETNPSRRTLHFSEMFMDRAAQTLSPLGISLGPALNCKPRLWLPRQVVETALCRFGDKPHPWIFFVPRSNSYAVRQVPDPVWAEAAKRINGTCFWLGTMPAPSGIVDLEARHLDNVIAWLSAADLVVSVDTGPMHIAAALGKQLICLGQSSSPELHLSDQRDFETIWPQGGLKCLNCQENICRINHYLPPCQSFDPEKIAARSNEKLSALNHDSVSAIISIFRPEVGVLNRCLESVIPQVQEVIVCHDKASIIPNGALQHGKVRYVESRLFNSGYGRKQNVAARHSCGAFLLLLNDDVFLDPGAVERMREIATSDSRVGMVSNLLRYPDGTIYYAGKIRTPGMRGWIHVNHKQHLPDIKEPAEMENCCGACVLVRRKAFYDIGGFNERIYLYSEDDIMSLDLRRHGWKLMHQPHSTAVHMEHQSTTKTGNLVEYLNASNRIFHELYGPYLEHNISRVPGNFDYCKA